MEKTMEKTKVSSDGVGGSIDIKALQRTILVAAVSGGILARNPKPTNNANFAEDVRRIVDELEKL